VARLLFDAARRQRTTLFGKDSQVETLIRRIEMLRETGLCTDLGPEDIPSEETLLKQACNEMTSLSELEGVDWPSRLLASLPHDTRTALREHTPTEVALPSGRKLQVNYEASKPPWVASRLQDFFGMQQGPKICGGRVPLTLHLLAPNGRAVQVTADLSGFWSRHYSEVRKELRRRYVKHAWPQDGATAKPPEPRAKRPNKRK
jgi:ATP-dependent helicase HrpB